jgi:Myb-like DNA-binding protein FlbD
MSRAHRRGPWVAEEDATLLSLVASRGPNNWVQISQHMHFRSPKQCRERYHQNLKASLNHDPISADEGELIEEMVSDMGKKWAEIARRLGNRSDNAVKNWWNGSQSRRKRNVPHHGSSSKTLSNRTQPLSAVRLSRSPAHHDARHRNYDNRSPRCDQAWQDLGSSDLSRHTLRSQQSQPARGVYAHEHSRSDLHEAQRFRDTIHYGQRTPERSPPPILRRSAATDPNRHQLPPLGLINTSQPPPSLALYAMQPPHSANSMDRAPSLVSDHNSTYSISPKTWPSPRPDLPTLLDTSRSRWNEPTHIYRRGSAPVISPIVSLPFTGDEGYGSAIAPSASSEPKYLIPTLAERTASFDDHYSNNNNHRYSVSNPTISLSPMAEPRNKLKEPPSARDTRMNFSSLLN